MGGFGARNLRVGLFDLQVHRWSGDAIPESQPERPLQLVPLPQLCTHVEMGVSGLLIADC